MLVYLMIGAPGSGKSTYVSNYLSQYYIISCDDIREKSFGHERSFEIRSVVYEKILVLIRDLVRKNISFVIDTTYFNEIKCRKELSNYMLVKNIQVMYFEKTLELCLSQNIKREPSRIIKPEMIKYLFDKVDPPGEYEGFKSINVIK